MSTISYSCGLTVLDAASGARADVLVSIDGTATVREVAHAIEHALAPPPRRRAARRHGGVAVPRYAQGTSLAEPGGVAEVRVVGGPAAGSVHRLGLGRFEIGGDPGCAVAVADPAVRRAPRSSRSPRMAPAWSRVPGPA